ncbi:MAG: cobalt transporter subunit CbtA [Gammaproteobacteria bacterium]|jgi:cobalt transporter subunit CbtA
MPHTTCATQLASPATKLFSRIVTSALFAGAAAGLLIALLQYVFVQPVLLHAELYESGTLIHFGADSISAVQDVASFDPLRDLLSVLFTMLTYCGYAFILVSLMGIAEERGAIITPRNGMIWGLMGFIAAHLAPAFSLPPEVPGVAAADVLLRQYWWFATVALAAISMWLIAFHFTMIGIGAAVVLLLLPHIVGAPQPAEFTGPVPTEIGALFAARALTVGLVAWTLLGAFCAYFWTNEGEVA